MVSKRLHTPNFHGDPTGTHTDHTGFHADHRRRLTHDVTRQCHVDMSPRGRSAKSVGGGRIL
jgi:hypothetical protein